MRIKLLLQKELLNISGGFLLGDLDLYLKNISNKNYTAKFLEEEKRKKRIIYLPDPLPRPVEM